ncbi:MAG: hypothetical protein OEV94_00670 [Deltaproteobacteria bacterium]|nr:hypothetical protein [Deltaproteobacteria bacterium]
MAAKPTPVTIQIVNVDLAVERQKILREKLRDLFKAMNAASGDAPRELVYTQNQENHPLEVVLRGNPHADVLFTTFNYDQSASLVPDEPGEEPLVGSALDDLNAPPHLRYPLLGEFLNLETHGFFRHRRLVLVGDLHDKLGQFFRSNLSVSVALAPPGGGEPLPPEPMGNLERFTRDDAMADQGKIPVSRIRSLSVAGVVFHAAVHMPEEGNRFVLKDITLAEAAKMIYALEGVRGVVFRETLRSERMAFVRGKRVVMVLPPDLDQVVAERLTFDRMEHLYRYTEAPQALMALSDRGAKGKWDALESTGYEAVFNTFGPEERDQLLTAVLAERLGETTLRELQPAKAVLSTLTQEEIHDLFYRLPPRLLDQLLEHLKETSFERFLTYVPAKIRETLVMEVLKDPAAFGRVWAAMAEPFRKDVLTQQAPQMLAEIWLTDSPLFKTAFPQLTFPLMENYQSQAYSSLKPPEAQAVWASLAKQTQTLSVPKGLLTAKLNPDDQTRFTLGYVARVPEEFYNRLSPVHRKDLWTAIAREYRSSLVSRMQFLDKVDVLDGNRDAAMKTLLDLPPLHEALKAGAEPAYARLLLLTLKKYNKAESKAGLLKKVLTQGDWKAVRLAGLEQVMADPQQADLAARLAEHLEEGEPVFDSLVCLRDDLDALTAHPRLAGVSVTLVDDLVDPAMWSLFELGRLSRDDYLRHSGQVEAEIDALRKNLSGREKEDPVGVYMVESLYLLQQTANQAAAGTLEPSALKELDQQAALRRRLVEGMKNHLAEIESFLGKGDQVLKEADEKITATRELAVPQGEALGLGRQELAKHLEVYQKAFLARERGNRAKRKVAGIQKQLSLEFFRLIRPLILHNIAPLTWPFRALLRGVFLRLKGAARHRIIFRFTDGELKRIVRRRIVFTTGDRVLQQFIVTCLRIDNLQNTLFTLAAKESPPPKADLLFYGPDCAEADFSSRVKAGKMLPFADKNFADRLLENEREKARVKMQLAKVEEETNRRKAAVEDTAAKVKTVEARIQEIEAAVEKLHADKAVLLERMETQRERRQHFQEDLDMLEARLGDVDQDMENLRKEMEASMAQGGGEAINTLETSGKQLSAKLQHNLADVSQKMARLMLIKGVKDAGSLISRTTQDGILEVMDSREQFSPERRPVKKVIVADDGSHLGQNLRRVMEGLLHDHFSLKDKGLEGMTLHRLEHLVDTKEPLNSPFVVACTQAEGKDLEALRKLVKKFRLRLPDVYLMVFAPLGESSQLQEDPETLATFRAIKENACLVNASLYSPEDPAGLQQLLVEKAPLG